MFISSISRRLHKTPNRPIVVDVSCPNKEFGDAGVVC